MSYRPVSGCGSGCLPRPGSVAEAAWPVRAARLLALLGLLVGALGVALSLPLLTAGGRRRTIRGWFRLLLRACGVTLVVRGGARLAAGKDADANVSANVSASAGGTLVVANHVSWLDIPALMAVEPVRLLAKSEVRGWPVLGLLAARAGTVFIDRERLRRLPLTVAELAAALRGGETVAVFPEGSTWCGRTHQVGSSAEESASSLGRFYPATLQAAVDAGAPVRPVAIRYRWPDGTPTTQPAFLGEDTLIASLRRVIRARALVAELEVRAPLSPTRTRRQLAAAAHRQITRDRESSAITRDRESSAVP